MPVVTKKVNHIFTDEERAQCEPILFPTTYLKCHPNHPLHEIYDYTLDEMIAKNSYWTSIRNYMYDTTQANRNNWWATEGYKTAPFLNNLFYNTMKDALTETGLDITFDDEKHGFTLFGSKFYILLLYMQGTSGLQNHNYAVPFIFQENDYSIQLNSFKTFPSANNTINKAESTGWLPEGVFKNGFFKTDYSSYPSDQTKWAWWTKLISMDFSIRILYNENYVLIYYYMENNDPPETPFLLGTIVRCNVCNGKKILYTSSLSMIPCAANDLVTTTAYITKSGLPVINEGARNYPCDGAFGGAVFELTDPEDNTKPITYYGPRKAFFRNGNLKPYFMDYEAPTEQAAEMMFSINGGVIPTDHKMVILKQVTMLKGTIQVPHIYMCDEKNFKELCYYEINGKQYFCPVKGILYEL